MRAVLLIDFGSTNTKITAVDMDLETVLGTAVAYTTVETDINDGLSIALNKLYEKTGLIDFSERYACSSAAGGLRMVTSGLVPTLTGEAAKLASLGAGAKVVGVYSYRLIDEDIVHIDELSPDILLLTGGTDGGNTGNIIENARMVAGCKGNFPVVIAGNRVASRECENILKDSGKSVYIVKNVMPSFGELCIDSAKDAIREIFLHRIVKAKGLSKISELIDGIMMPTPSAMLTAMKLLCEGTRSESGIGDLFAVDLGGATTDVYSISDGFPSNANTIIKGIKDPHEKRTVEGDIGMRYSISGIVEAASPGELARLSGLDEARVGDRIAYLHSHMDAIPETSEAQALDFALASIAVRTAAVRHAGRIEQVYTPTGLVHVQEGKDLTGVTNLVITGGAVIHSPRVTEIASSALFSEDMPFSLRPKCSRIYVDKNYILAAMGLLSKKYPDAALRIMKKELILTHGSNK